jgi:hypothetical protein
VKKVIRILAVLLVLAGSTTTTMAHLLGGDPYPTCSPADPSCVPPSAAN